MSEKYLHAKNNGNASLKQKYTVQQPIFFLVILYLCSLHFIYHNESRYFQTGILRQTKRAGKRYIFIEFDSMQIFSLLYCTNTRLVPKYLTMFDTFKVTQ